MCTYVVYMGGDDAENNEEHIASQSSDVGTYIYRLPMSYVHWKRTLNIVIKRIITHLRREYYSKINRTLLTMT